MTRTRVLEAPNGPWHAWMDAGDGHESNLCTAILRDAVWYEMELHRLSEVVLKASLD